MTYVEYCRMKCFSNKENFTKKTAEEQAEDLHKKRMESVMKGCRTDNRPNDSSADVGAANVSDGEYQRSLKTCKVLKIAPKDCNATGHADDAFWSYRRKPECDKK